MTIDLLTEKQLDSAILNPDQEIVINNIYQLYQIIDYANLFIKEKYNTPDCQRCGICCNGVFDVSPVEAQIIRDALKADRIPQGLFPPIPENIVKERLNLARVQLHKVTQENLFICPFYSPEVGCLIYKVRTLICRVFEVAVPGPDFIEEVKDDLLGNTAGISSGILCPNLKAAKKYPDNFMVWDLEGLTLLLDKIYPGSTRYEARLLAFFIYDTKSYNLSGLPQKFSLADYLKVVSY